MKLTANEEYGLRCLVRIGYAGHGGSITIPEMSQAEGVSAAYAAKILRVLRKGGFVTAARGKEGGYTLARPAEGHASRPAAKRGRDEFLGENNTGCGPTGEPIAVNRVVIAYFGCVFISTAIMKLDGFPPPWDQGRRSYDSSPNQR
jgi:Iron-dependent Transcriptional regulator